MALDLRIGEFTQPECATLFDPLFATQKEGEKILYSFPRSIPTAALCWRTVWILVFW
jgi:hypothetical protein